MAEVTIAGDDNSLGCNGDCYSSFYNNFIGCERLREKIEDVPCFHKINEKYEAIYLTIQKYKNIICSLFSYIIPITDLSKKVKRLSELRFRVFQK